jgi:hypothetical protein
MAGERNPVVPVRYPPADLERIEVAMRIMGSPNISHFTRSASVTLANAIIEASIASGINRTSWDNTWIEGELERKP